MAYSGFTWAPMISVTATKYQRHGYVEKRAFLPGERRSAAREMERTVKGYRELRQELADSRKMIREQEQERRSTVEKTIQTSFYKSPVGTRTQKGSGAIFYSDPVGRTIHFSATKRI
eukprot:GFUD01125773.1.p1 GENE.GFUD01125773.1~~GFUD01125773.1.p1  ORF type:complete len:117 (-),score=38.69 GFUD01125773.1:134-484(-)